MDPASREELTQDTSQSASPPSTCLSSKLQYNQSHHPPLAGKRLSVVCSSALRITAPSRAILTKSRLMTACLTRYPGHCTSRALRAAPCAWHKRHFTEEQHDARGPLRCRCPAPRALSLGPPPLPAAEGGRPGPRLAASHPPRPGTGRAPPAPLTRWCRSRAGRPGCSLTRGACPSPRRAGGGTPRRRCGRSSGSRRHGQHRAGETARPTPPARPRRCPALPPSRTSHPPLPARARPHRHSPAPPAAPPRGGRQPHPAQRGSHEPARRPCALPATSRPAPPRPGRAAAL